MRKTWKFKVIPAYDVMLLANFCHQSQGGRHIGYPNGPPLVWLSRPRSSIGVNVDTRTQNVRKTWKFKVLPAYEVILWPTFATQGQGARHLGYPKLTTISVAMTSQGFPWG
jgi:hypothetical protein